MVPIHLSDEKVRCRVLEIPHELPGGRLTKLRCPEGRRGGVRWERQETKRTSRAVVEDVIRQGVGLCKREVRW
jgi:hypothetical protein